MKRNNSTATTKRRRNSRRRQLQSEQLETRALLSGWTIAVTGDTGGIIQPRDRQAVDGYGNTYVAGDLTGSYDFDPTTNQQFLTGNSETAGGADSFAARYNSDGSLHWARKIDGVATVSARAVVFDGSGATGAVVVAGVFTGAADFTGDGISDASSVGGTDGFVVKLDAQTGATIWYRTIGGTRADQVNDVAVRNGQVYLAGQFSDTVDFNPGAGVFTLSTAGKGRQRMADGFVQTLDANGNFVTAWQIGGSGIDYVNHLQLDAGGDIFVVGQFTDTADFKPGSGTLNRTSAGQFDAFLARYTPAGNPLWVQTIGGADSEGDDWALAASADGLYVTASFRGALDIDPGAGSFLVNSGDNFTDAFVAKYTTTSGAFLWARSFGLLGTHESAGLPAAIDPLSGNVFVGAGIYGTIDLNPTAPGGELTSAGSRDSALIKLNPQGGFLNAWRFGGPGSDGGARVAGVVGNTIYVVGWIGTGAADFPTGDTVINPADQQGLYVMALNDPAAPPSPLLAAAVPAKSVDQSLTASQYEPILAEAQRRWQAAGVNTAALSGLNVQVRKLGGTTLGLASGNTIWLDDNAAGWGWFVDSTPGNSSEFLQFGNQGEQHRMDLLTVVMHELGHILGQDHDVEGVMAETLVAGVRRTDTEHDHLALVDQVFGQTVDHHTEGLLGTLLDDRLNPRGLWFKRRR